MIALLGATGTIGAHVAVGMAERGIEARALVRNPDRTDLPVPAVGADLRQPASLRKALHGARTLFLLTPHGPDQDLQEEAALEAALAAGVERIVKVSGGMPSLGPNGVTATAVAHWRSERRIEDSGVSFAFLRPSFLMQNLLGSAAPIVAGARAVATPIGRAPIAMVDARDVAACAAVALSADGLPDNAWQLTGPRPVSYADVAEALGAFHLRVPFRIAGFVLRRQGAGEGEADHALRMARYFAAGCDGATTDAVEHLTGRAPRALDAFLADNAQAFGRRA